MRTLQPIPILLFTFLIIFAGCSGGSNPVIPSGNNNPASVTSSNRDSSTGTLGLFSVRVDTASLEGEMVPLREAMSKDVLEVIDITNFLAILPCNDCAKLHSVYLDSDENLVLDIGIRHPFAPGNPMHPPSATNRLDLHLFNVEGIVVIDSGEYVEFTNLETSIDAKRLLNSSGYTGYLDNSLDSVFPTVADIHPYILHFRDYSEGNFDAMDENGFTDLTDPSGYLVMPMGCDEDIRSYVFSLEQDETLEFIFAIGATYGISTDSPAGRLNPVYSLPQFNKKAASEVSVEILGNNLIPELSTSSVLLGISILDMNYGVEVGDAINEMRSESNIASIAVLIPGIGQMIRWAPDPVGGDPRDPDNPLAFEIEIFNHSSGIEGQYSGLVKVVDNCPTGLNETSILSAKDGISRVDIGQNALYGLFDIDAFVTWQYFEIGIIANQPPVAELEASSMEIACGEYVDLFPGAGTHDPDGEIVLYEYDFDWDGITFDVDASNTTGEPVSTPVYENYTGEPIFINCAMRVTDDGTPVLTDMDEITITVNPYETSGWARTWGGDFSDLGLCVALHDGDGVYAAGGFTGTVDFDPGIEIEERTAIGEGDAFLAKYDLDGRFMWVQAWGGDSDYPDGDRVYAITVDDMGKIIVTGTYFGLTDFDPGAGVDEHQAAGLADVFISQFDSDGMFIMAQTWGSEGYDYVHSIAVDDSGNILVAGSFEGEIDFDPGTDLDIHEATGFLDAYASKFDSSLYHLWANSWGTSLDRSFGVATDSMNSIYVTGYFMDTVDFDPGVGTDERTSNGEADIFLSKFDSNGGHIWAVTWGSAGELYWQRDVGNDVAVDEFDNVFVTGSFYGTADFDPGMGEDERIADGALDAYLSRFTSDGEYVWALTWGSMGDEPYHGDAGIGLGVDSAGCVFVTGGFHSTVDFDPGAGIVEYTSNGSVDAFLSKFNTDGEFQWAGTWGAFGLDDCMSVAVDMYGSSYVTGHFNDTVDFNPGADVNEYESNGYLDAYLSKFPADGEW